MFAIAQSVREKNSQEKNGKMDYRTFTREMHSVCSSIRSFTTVFQKGLEMAPIMVHCIMLKKQAHNGKMPISTNRKRLNRNCACIKKEIHLMILPLFNKMQRTGNVLKY